MVDEEGIRLASPWWLCKAFRPAGCLTESSRGAFDPAKNQTFDFLEVCTGAVCQPNADVVMWLFGFLCGSQLQHELPPRPFWRTGAASFQICFFTWEVMKYLGTVGTTVKIWHGWFFGNDGGFAVGYPGEIKLGEGGMRPDERLIWKLRMAVVKKTTPGF